MNYKLRKIKKTLFSIFIVIFSYFILHTSYLVAAVNAQAISLSVSPPLFELMIQPGKEVKQIYTITNGGGDTTLSPKISYFTSSDEEGNIDLTDDPAPDWIKYSKDPIKINSGDKIDFNVLFSPPADINETDHFLTLVFETTEPADILNQNATVYKTQIGTNILITVSKDGNPKKSAEIIEFSAPKVIDSLFGEMEYLVTIKNNGNSFWKPIGKIIYKDETLKISPQNILSGYARKISCIENENLIECKLKNNFRIGKIVSKLEFSTDEDSAVYKTEATTLAFPFSIIFLTLILLTIIKSRGIFKIWRKRK